VRLVLPRPVRRLLLPVDAVVLLVLATAFALITVAGTVLAPVSRRRRVLRMAAFALSYCVVELVVMIAAGLLWLRHVVSGRRDAGSEASWVHANQRLLAWALGRVLGASRRFLGFDVAVVETSDTTKLAEIDPVLVLARHGGPGDSFALVHLLLTRYERRVRIVLKEILQLDPALDILLNRLNCCFLATPSGDGGGMTDRLALMASGMGPGDALLLFPEGANWTPDRRRRAIHHLRRHHKTHAARAATLMTNVLPPRPDGVFTCLDANPGLDVVIVAHAGLDRIFRARQAWDQLPLTTPMTVRAWPTAEVPKDREARLAWLTLEWAVVDEWVDAFHAGQNLTAENGTAT
jgi:1-acyl-sn-glycerol-3-phosphate acyltransferase